MMKQQILGAGSVGHMVAGILSSANQSSQIIVKNDGHRNTTASPKYIYKNESIQLLSEYIRVDDVSQIELLWVCVKSYQLEDALKLVRAKCSHNTHVLLLQNGMGHLEVANAQLADLMPLEQIFIVANTHGAYLDHQAHGTEVYHTGLGKMIIGPNYLAGNTAKPDFLDELPKSMNIAWEEQIEQESWLKLGINAVINPLTAYYQCTNGELLSNLSYRKEVDTLLTELKDFYRAVGMSKLAEVITSRCYHVIETTSENYSSMMRDVKSGRQTEIDSITGYLLNQASQTKLNLVEHQKQYDRLLNT